MFLRRTGVRRAKDLREEIRAALYVEFLSHNPQGTVGGDEVNRLNPFFTLDGEQEVAKENGSAGAGGCDGQILRRVVRQSGLRFFRRVVSSRISEHRDFAKQKSRRGRS